MLSRRRWPGGPQTGYPGGPEVRMSVPGVDHPHVLPVQIYYEDTDHSGVVYHANYRRYFERGREHLLGSDELVRLEVEEGIGFVVYKVGLRYRAGARHGDRLEIRSLAKAPTDYRAVFDQQAWRGDELLVKGDIELCCVDRTGRPVRLPASVRELLRSPA